MSKKTILTISSIAMAISAITCLYAVLNGMNTIPALGMFLCTITIYCTSLAAYKKDKKDK